VARCRRSRSVTPLSTSLPNPSNTISGLFPGVNYYLSCWYKRSEFGIRAAIFFSAAALAGSFGGLLAAGIAQMRGVGGKPGWAWIFVRLLPIPTLPLN
jgi:hypothetical protein